MKSTFMKSTFIGPMALLVAGLMFSGIASAQERHAGQGERHLQKMQQKLELSDEQVEQLRDLWAQGREQREQQRGQMREQLSGILTPEQLEKMDEQRQNWRRGGEHDGRKGMKGGCDSRRSAG